VEDDISRRIENSRKLIARLKQVKPQPPPYATSVLQSAVHNKGRVLEAHLSTMEDGQKEAQVNEVDEEHGRSACFYAAYYGNIEALELLAASDARFNLTDKYHRTALHYAALNNQPKVVEAVVLAFKHQGKPVILSGQVDEDANALMKTVPPATFSPFKGIHDEMDKKRK